MKCPKCDYLGFDTGTRCRHCGYDFSLLTTADVRPAPPPAGPADLRLRPEHPPAGAADGRWVDAPLVSPDAAAPVAGAAVPAAEPAAARVRRPADTSLPLFSAPAAPTDESPLLRVPAAPRPPLAVRRTPETPRLKAPALARTAGERTDRTGDESLVAGPRLRDATPYATVDADLHIGSPAGPARTRTHEPPRGPVSAAAAADACGAWPRVLAAALDLAILLLIDLAVVYFTLKMAGLTVTDWRVLPLTPLLSFLMLLKLAYYTAFTACGGQTIGKMAAHIRVVAEDEAFLDPATAVRRTCAALASVLTLGAAFVPALVGPSRQALHDRIAGTRVVALPPA